MEKEVIINHTHFKADDFQHEKVKDKQTDQLLDRIHFSFKVKSEDYHMVTTLLYKNDFNIEVPHLHLSFRGEITNYSTSITNLYEENQVGDYMLELTETSR
ncbi:DUF3219 family protein [Heyndrickxia acidicola]|uniref:DUF3219 family protein n=1 Tax=Heyndrickxia acidicola TaxID=209389 RepID=A0ABU6MHM9_9BACI|nr:DUF3219 family protein [Heyndrickxia acidicola]MED1203804.1 DUF3219 family protein [Heyndrickxia acidicola]